MLLAMDIGNTNIKSALFNGEKMPHYWRIATDRSSTSDEYGIKMEQMFRHEHIKMPIVDGIIISSVVPTVNYTLDHMCRDFFGIEPLFVNPGIDIGIDIKYDDPGDLGSDRICNAIAAYTIWGGPCISIDFGTATSFGVVDRDGAFLGGCICPGIRIASEALVTGTAKLPHYELIKPPKVVGRSTVSNLQSGVIYGYVGQVEYLVERMREEVGEKAATVIATGGFAHLIASETKVIDKIDSLLTLKGLRLLYERNTGRT